MRIQILMACVAVPMGVLFSPVSKAACDSKCVGESVENARIAAYDAMEPNLARDKKLGKLVRAEAVLTACGDKGKARAIQKLRAETMIAAITKGLHEASLKSSDHEQGLVEFSSFYGSAQAVTTGYLAGYQEMTKIAISVDKNAREALCEGWNKTADALLFGDKPEGE